ncbi:MAG: hypothetical protein JW924_00030 [Fusobacteriaceae bacterium]|nr:hypothetical protein [Fusobacteriaceae bacterium]
MNQKEFENNVMEMLLDGENEILSKLRKQYEHSKVISREFSTAGFFISFTVEDRGELCLEGKSFYIGDVGGIVNGIESAIGFILFIKNGYISLLEGYTNIIDNWPTNEEITLAYDSGKTRNIKVLNKKL